MWVHLLFFEVAEEIKLKKPPFIQRRLLKAVGEGFEPSRGS